MNKTTWPSLMARTRSTVSLGAQNRPVEGASKPARVRQESSQVVGWVFWQTHPGDDDGERDQHGRETDDCGTSRTGAVESADRQAVGTGSGDGRSAGGAAESSKPARGAHREFLGER